MRFYIFTIRTRLLQYWPGLHSITSLVSYKIKGVCHTFYRDFCSIEVTLAETLIFTFLMRKKGYSSVFLLLLSPPPPSPTKVRKLENVIKMSVCSCLVIFWYFLLLVSYLVNSLMCWSLPDPTYLGIQRLVHTYKSHLTRNYFCPGLK